MAERQTGLGNQKPDLRKVFQEDEKKLEVIGVANYVLTAMRVGVMKPDALDPYLVKPEWAFLTTPDGRLEGATPLDILTEDLLARVPQPRRQQELHSRVQRSVSIRGTEYDDGHKTFHGGYLADSFETVGKPEDIGGLSGKITSVHLTQQAVINSKSIQKILENCPDLDVLEVPGSFLRLIHPNIRRLLSERGVELRVGRVHDPGYYDDLRLTSGNFDDKNRLFELKMQDEIYRYKFSEMVRLKMVEAVIAREYFKRSARRKSLRDIADEFGLPYHEAERNFDAFMYWLGGNIKEKHAVSKGRTLEKRLNRLLEAERGRKV